MAHMALYKLNLLDQFENRRDAWTFADFEKSLVDAWRGVVRQDAKSIINAAHQEKKWPKTVKRYLLTNYKAFGNVSSEFDKTFADVVASMSPQERATWGL
ncbi:hypothetical protein [Pseudomonas sp. Teo4]|uniref:hypothetical protein n=1 Tax=Pseudomonas sp. Teo4 TaxID=3064528 RepID=UPI002ABCE180|nr:hypothetical protein [Pseudomonas sp. Teo4]MDZ3991350.1 hypothetical protein [Pseudomonas sp. Teo4]